MNNPFKSIFKAKAKAKAKPAMEEVGTSGLNISGGVVREDYDPNLSGRNGRKTFHEMSESSPVIGAALLAIETLLRQAAWSVQPASSDAVDLESAEFLEQCMDDMTHPWENLITEALSMLVYGWSYHEIVYKARGGKTGDSQTDSKYDDGRIGWRKISARSQLTLSRWLMDENGGLEAMIQQDPNSYREITIPIEKALLFRTSVKYNNPEGRSALRSSYRPWYFGKNIEKYEGIGVQRDLAGIPKITAPSNYMKNDATADQKALYEYMKNVGRGLSANSQAYVFLPSDLDMDGKNKKFDIELMSSGGKRNFDTDKIINRYDQRILMTFLAQFIMLGMGKTGSFALSSDQTTMFSMVIGAWLTDIGGVINRFAIPRLFGYNSFNIIEFPKVVHSDIEKVSLDTLINFVSKAVQSGAIEPGRAMQEHLREMGGLPTLEEEDMQGKPAAIDTDDEDGDA